MYRPTFQQWIPVPVQEPGHEKTRACRKIKDRHKTKRAEPGDEKDVQGEEENENKGEKHPLLLAESDVRAVWTPSMTVACSQAGRPSLRIPLYIHVHEALKHAFHELVPQQVQFCVVFFLHDALLQ